jgi:hypothetical protein
MLNKSTIIMIVIANRYLEVLIIFDFVCSFVLTASKLRLRVSALRYK